MILSQRIKSPAKINLFLYLVGRDHRGYHQLQSLFYILPNLYDLLDFNLTNKNGIKVTSNYKIENNLVKRAAELLLIEAGLLDKIGLSINLEKNIPIGGGFGGGSSNAATTLLTINKDLKLGASHEDLIKMAEKLGDDVKIFLFKKDFIYLDSDKITSLDLKIPLNISFYNSKITIFTKDLYDLARQKILKFNKIIQSEDDIISHILEGSNDLYPLALELAPELALVKDSLEKNFSLVRMTGSGGGFFMM
jgi:4-diphosphocytidyl-2-C-methyl-D-erythritol kinase